MTAGAKSAGAHGESLLDVTGEWGARTNRSPAAESAYTSPAGRRRRGFVARSACEIGDGYELVNSIRLVTIEIYDRLSAEAQLAIATDLLTASEEVWFRS